MTTQRNPENKQEHRPHDLGQIIAGQNQPGSRELIEEQLDAMQGANLTATIKVPMRRGITRTGSRLPVQIRI